MSRSFFLLLFILTGHGFIYAQPAKYKYSFTESKMGSPFHIILVTGDSLKAASLAKQSYALIDSFNLVFSDYDSSSELSRLNKLSGSSLYQKVSPALWNLLLDAKRAFQKSGHAFDITVGPLSQLWRKARKNMFFPDSAVVAEKRKTVGFSNIQFRAAEHSIRLPVAGMRLDLGGIAKGYIAQQVIDFLSEQGITQALADAGGDMAMSKAAPGSRGWVIGVNIPENTEALLPQKLLLQNMAVATSGDAFQYMEHNGIKYSHIIDPRTGYGISSQRNVTVITKNGTDADWLATACSILPIVSAKRLAVANHAELLITELKNRKIIYHVTKGFRRYWKPY